MNERLGRSARGIMAQIHRHSWLNAAILSKSFSIRSKLNRSSVRHLHLSRDSRSQIYKCINKFSFASQLCSSSPLLSIILRRRVGGCLGQRWETKCSHKAWRSVLCCKFPVQTWWTPYFAAEILFFQTSVCRAGKQTEINIYRNWKTVEKRPF